jgi:hypothetical protein
MTCTAGVSSRGRLLAWREGSRTPDGVNDITRGDGRGSEQAAGTTPLIHTLITTPKGNIAVVDGRGDLLDVYDEDQAFIDNYGDRDRSGTQEMVRQVTKALGLKSVRELDS